MFPITEWRTRLNGIAGKIDCVRWNLDNIYARQRMIKESLWKELNELLNIPIAKYPYENELRGLEDT